MSEFTTKLNVEPVGENIWELIEAFEYHIGKYPSDEIILAPEGFVTDFASVPKVFWRILPPNGKYGKAAVIHDYCYSTACYGRIKSDLIFLEGMKVLKVKRWKRNSMYTAVVLFGWWAWYKQRFKQYRKRRC